MGYPAGEMTVLRHTAWAGFNGCSAGRTEVGSSRALALALGLTITLGSATAQRTAEADLSARRAEYQARAERLPADDAVGHFALAQWCEKKHLTMARRWELRQVLKSTPDHVSARRALGQVFHGGRWMSRADANRARGMVLVGDRWLSKYEAYKLRHPRTDPDRHLSLRYQTSLLFARLADPRSEVRKQALVDLLALAKTAKVVGLTALALVKSAEFENYWRRRPIEPSRSTGLISINLVRSELLGMETRSIGLGTGRPVRIQLPRVRTISIGTTLPIPLGRTR